MFFFILPNFFAKKNKEVSPETSLLNHCSCHYFSAMPLFQALPTLSAMVK